MRIGATNMLIGTLPLYPFATNPMSMPHREQVVDRGVTARFESLKKQCRPVSVRHHVATIDRLKMSQQMSVIGQHPCTFSVTCVLPQYTLLQKGARHIDNTV